MITQYSALVVDDDLAMRLLMRESLEQAGLIVDEAENGADALDVFGRCKPDIVLMDVQMPVMDGFDACSKLRQLTGGDEVVIVMVTGLEDITSIERAYDVGATDFIAKPVNWPILNHRLRYLIRAKVAFKKLRESETRLSQAQSVAHLGDWEWDIESKLLHWSDESYRIFGRNQQTFEPTYEEFLNAVHPDDLEAVTNAVERSLYHRKPYNIDHRITLPDGTERIVHEQAKVVFNGGGKPISMYGTVQDITERIKAENKIRRLAYYDSLTGLPNRQLSKEHLHRALRSADRNNTMVALIYLDLDRFKQINDTLGHTAGDEFLKNIAKRLTEIVRDSDVVAKAQEQTRLAFALSRLGGDEFTILLAGLTKVAYSVEVAKRIKDMLNLPFKVGGQEFFVTGSMGIAVYPNDGGDADTLLKNADTAMYKAKDSGKNTFKFYEPKMNSQALARLSMESELRHALKNDEMMLEYQPQMDAQTGRIVGIEALVRWNHPKKGKTPPHEFIPLAEETGLIVPIGEWVLEKACMQNKAWQLVGCPPVPIAVNVSGIQFRQRNLVDKINDILKETGLNPRFLELELTESTIMRNVDRATKMLKALKASGLSLAVDDFGTGYSSMAYLKLFPLDVLKIDRTFVRDILTDPSDAAIVKAVISLAKSLDLIVVAEGVETKEQLAILKEFRCDVMQGYLFSRPVSADEIVPFLEMATSHRKI